MVEGGQDRNRANVVVKPSYVFTVSLRMSSSSFRSAVMHVACSLESAWATWMMVISSQLYRPNATDAQEPTSHFRLATTSIFREANSTQATNFFSCNEPLCDLCSALLSCPVIAKSPTMRRTLTD